MTRHSPGSHNLGHAITIPATGEKDTRLAYADTAVPVTAQFTGDVRTADTTTWSASR